MNILYIERCLSKKSIIFDQITRLNKYVENHTIAVQVAKFPLVKQANVTSVKCPFFPKLEQVKAYLFCKAALKGFKKLEDKKFDLIHSHFAYPEGLAAYELSRKYKIPYVITGRGTDILLYPKHNKYLRRMIKKTLANCSGFIGVSTHIINEAVKLGLDRKKAYFSPDGILDEVFLYNSEIKKGNQTKTVLFAGSLLPVKNVLAMIEAFSIVLKTNIDIHFQIVGDGPLKKEMLKSVNKFNMQKTIMFLGQLDHKQLAEKMQQANVLCLPSISEGWGNVITEAMACGTPVVGSNVGGIPEQIISDEYGCLCDPSSPEDIAAKILKALYKKWDYQKISERGSMYTREGTAKRIAKQYKCILESYSPKI